VEIEKKNVDPTILKTKSKTPNYRNGKKKSNNNRHSPKRIAPKGKEKEGLLPSKYSQRHCFSLCFSCNSFLPQFPTYCGRTLPTYLFLRVFF
jgi:hypothetical protein